MFNIRTHSHHIYIQALEEKQVISQILYGLSGQSNHHAGAYLIARFAQVFKAFYTFS